MQINISPPHNTDVSSAECQNMVDLIGDNILGFLCNYPNGEHPAIDSILLCQLEQHLFNAGLGKYKFHPSRNSLLLGELELEVLEWNVPVKPLNISVSCKVVGDYHG